MVGGGDPFYLKFWVNRPPLERNRRFWTYVPSQRFSRSTETLVTVKSSELRSCVAIDKHNARLISALSYLIIAFAVHICTDDDATQCSPRWTVYPEIYSSGSQRNRSVTTQQQCLLACLGNPRCVAVEWTYNYQCWLHQTPPGRRRLTGITTFVPNRRCGTATGIVVTHTSLFTEIG